MPYSLVCFDLCRIRQSANWVWGGDSEVPIVSPAILQELEKGAGAQLQGALGK
jgi:hypothetical protein